MSYIWVMQIPMHIVKITSLRGNPYHLIVKLVVVLINLRISFAGQPVTHSWLRAVAGQPGRFRPSSKKKPTYNICNNYNL